MAEPKKKFYDVWFVRSNTVYKEVPYRIVTDWVQQSRLDADDMLKPSGAPNWVKVSSLQLFQAYLPQPEEQKVGDAAEALEPIELDFNWKRSRIDEDDDVDMIPLIDISLVLLIFFMMTTTVSQISRIFVPNMENAVKIEKGDVLRIDVDKDSNGEPVYSVAKGTAAPDEGDGDLRDSNALFDRFDAAVKAGGGRPKVRIAAHSELTYEVVRDVMNQLDKRRREGQIEEYHIEVNERAKR